MQLKLAIFLEICSFLPLTSCVLDSSHALSADRNEDIEYITANFEHRSVEFIRALTPTGLSNLSKQDRRILKQLTPADVAEMMPETCGAAMFRCGFLTPEATEAASSDCIKILIAARLPNMPVDVKAIPVQWFEKEGESLLPEILLNTPYKMKHLNEGVLRYINTNPGGFCKKIPFRALNYLTKDQKKIFKIECFTDIDLVPGTHIEVNGFPEDIVFDYNRRVYYRITSLEQFAHIARSAFVNRSNSNRSPIAKEMIAKEEKRNYIEKDKREAQYKRYLPLVKGNPISVGILHDYVYNAPLSPEFDIKFSPVKAVNLYVATLESLLRETCLQMFMDFESLLTTICNDVSDPRASYLGRAIAAVIHENGGRQIEILSSQLIQKSLKIFAVTKGDELLKFILIPNRRLSALPGITDIPEKEDGSFDPKKLYELVIKSPLTFASSNFEVYGRAIDEGGARKRLFNQACRNIVELELNFLKRASKSSYYRFPMLPDPKIGCFVGIMYARAREMGIMPVGRLDPRLMVLSTQTKNREAIEDYWDEVYHDEMEKLRNFFSPGEGYGDNAMEAGAKKYYQPLVGDIKYFSFTEPSKVLTFSHQPPQDYFPEDIRFYDTKDVRHLDYNTYLNDHLPELRKRAIDLFIELLREFSFYFSLVYDLSYISLLPDSSILNSFFSSPVEFTPETIVRKLSFVGFNMETDSFMKGVQVISKENIIAIVASMTQAQLASFVLAITAAENVDPAFLEITVKDERNLPMPKDKDIVFAEIGMITVSKARNLISEINDELRGKHPSIPSIADTELFKDKSIGRDLYKKVLTVNFADLLSEDEIDRYVEKAFSPSINEQELNELAYRAFLYQKEKFGLPDATMSSSIHEEFSRCDVGTCFSVMKVYQYQDAFGMLYAIASMINEDPNYMRG